MVQVNSDTAAAQKIGLIIASSFFVSRSNAGLKSEFQKLPTNQRTRPGATAMPGKGKPFPKGVSGNPGGRPKVLGDVQELARQKSPEAITTLANIMHDEKAPPAARVAAANALLDRGYGKPTQPISQTLAKIDPARSVMRSWLRLPSTGLQ
jgi:hypothetical protein